MESLFYNISQVLGITIIHSLWQGLLIWFALRLLFTCAPSMQAQKKHNWAMGALLATCVWFIYTLIAQLQMHTWVDLPATRAALLPHLYLPMDVVTNPQTSNYYHYVIESYLPYISALYFAGLVFNLLKVGLSWQRIGLIKKTMIPADQIQLHVDSFCQKLFINNYVSVNFSRLVDVPCMIGFFKPIILLPITLTTYLSTQEIEAILLHELSHIKRNDYLLNLVQQFITIVLFFNPFAQLINRIINQERENRCDDLVVQTTAQPLIYAQALLKLEQSRQVNLQLALAATGKKYHLLNRIERIMKTKKPIGNMRHLLVAVAIMTASISSIAWLNPTLKDGKISIKKAAYPKMVTDLLADTTHKKVIKTQKKVVFRKSFKNNSNNNIGISPYGITNDTELEKLTAEVERASKAMNKYYESHEFKEQTELIEQKGKAIEDYYNRPDVRKLYDEQEQLGKSFENNRAEMEQYSKEMEESGSKVSVYYNSPAFTNLVARLEKKYNIPHKRYYVSRDTADWNDNYKKFQAEISKSTPTEIKQQQELLTQRSTKISSLYDTPEFRRKTERINALRDSIDSPDIKQQQIEMAHLSEQLKARQYSPELKRQQKLLDEATKKLDAYTNSPAFKKRMAEYRKQMEAALNDKNNYRDMQPVSPNSF